MNRETQRDYIRQLLALRRDVRYRRGVIAAARMVDLLTQSEWERLRDEVIARIARPGKWL